MASAPEFLLVSEVARELRCSGPTVRRWEAAGKLPAARTRSGIRLFSSADVAKVKTQRSEKQNRNRE
jgi:excisionase family DNA binding protein